MESSSLETAIKVSPGTQFAAIPMLEKNLIILIKPTEPLLGDSTYTVVISQEAVSLAGIQLLETYEFSFKTKATGSAPTITSISPENGTIGNMAGQPITLVFDQRMVTDSVESAISITPSFDYSVVWTDDNTTAILQSHEPLEVNIEYTVAIGAGAMSGDGVPLAEEHQSNFTTGIMNLPQVLGTLPHSGQRNIPSNHLIQIVFDRSMDPESVEALLNVSPHLDYTTRWFEAEMVLQIKPTNPLGINTKYTIDIGAGALSSFGLPLENDYEFSFTTVG
jgi:hypothetical protein